MTQATGSNKAHPVPDPRHNDSSDGEMDMLNAGIKSNMPAKGNILFRKKGPAKANRS